MFQKAFQNFTACQHVTLWVPNAVGLQIGGMLVNEIVGVRKPIIVVGAFYLNHNMQKLCKSA